MSVTDRMMIGKSNLATMSVKNMNLGFGVWDFGRAFLPSDS